MQTAPARLGDTLEDVLTPALIVDLEALETNISAMAAHARHHGVSLRPHAKAHKCVSIARLQIAQGAVGICCQKTSEVEAFVAGGIEDILLTNQIVQKQKLHRLAKLARHARIAVCIDDAEQLRLLTEASASIGSTIGVLLEINVGHGRCGLADTAEIRRLACLIRDTKSLSFRGLHAFHGGAQHMRKLGQRAETISAAVRRVEAVKLDLEGVGLRVDTITGSGTGTSEAEGGSGVYTEIQPGSYVFMDADYAKNETPPPFRQALTILTTVMSVAVPGQIVVDAGHKAMGVDAGFPLPCREDLAVLGMSDEHTVLRQSTVSPLKLGERVAFVPGHIDPTINLHDWYVGIRRGQVECVWPIGARGAGL